MTIDRNLRPTLAVLVTVVAVFVSVAFVDRPAATFAHTAFRGAAQFVWLTHIVDPLLPLAALTFLAVGLGRLSGRALGRRSHWGLQAAVAALVAVAIKDQGKFAFGRLWPETWVNHNPSWILDGAYGFFPFHGGIGWSAFPSGHMTLITAPMVVLWAGLPRPWRHLAFVPVALVAIGLYGADYHFVADMIAGTLLGAICGLATRRLFPFGPRHEAATAPV